MNIFVTDPCPIKCAQHLDNKRLIKMVLETAQLLSTAIKVHGGPATYKITHKNHPCSVWARQTKGNYLWLLEHFKALLTEYSNWSHKTHACAKLLPELEQGIAFIPDGDKTQFANCAANQGLGISYKDVSDVHLAYFLYLNDRWDNDKIEPRWRD